MYHPALVSFHFTCSFFSFLISDGFVVLAIESFWTRLFSHYFIQTNDETRDDLLFYVKSNNSKESGKKLSPTEVSLCQITDKCNIMHGLTKLFLYSR